MSDGEFLGQVYDEISRLSEYFLKVKRVEPSRNFRCRAYDTDEHYEVSNFNAENKYMSEEWPF